MQLVYFANGCFNSCAVKSHKDSVRRATVEEEPKQRVVQLSEPSSTSLFLIFPGLSWESSQPSPSSWSRLDLQIIVQLFMRVQLSSLLLISPGPANYCPTLHESPALLHPLDIAWTISDRDRRWIVALLTLDISTVPAPVNRDLVTASEQTEWRSRLCLR